MPDFFCPFPHLERGSNPLCSPCPPTSPAAGVLNHKYTGENALRGSGLAYSILRPTGLTNESEGGPFLLEAHQGE